MTEDNWRAALAEALEERFSYATQYATVIIDWDEEAEAIAESPALRDLMTERDKLAAQVQMVEGALEDPDMYDVFIGHGVSVDELRRALGTPTRGGGE